MKFANCIELTTEQLPTPSEYFENLKKIGIIEKVDKNQKNVSPEFQNWEKHILKLRRRNKKDIK